MLIHGYLVIKYSRLKYVGVGRHLKNHILINADLLLLLDF